MHKIQFLKNLPSIRTASQKRIWTAQATSQVPASSKFNATLRPATAIRNNLQPEPTIPDPSLQHRSLNKSHSIAHTSKLAKHESTGVLYAKKNQQQEHKLKQLEEQIREVERQLEECRKDIASKKRTKAYIPKDTLNTSSSQNNFFLTTGGNFNGQSSKSIYRKNLNLNNPQQLRNEISIVQRRISGIKVKINGFYDQQKVIMSDINAARKQVLMYSEVIGQIAADLESVNYQFEKVSTQSRVASNDVASKYLELQKMKIVNSQGETQIIKRYDSILKKITQEFETSRLKQLHSERTTFMLTEAATNQLNPPHYNSLKSEGRQSATTIHHDRKIKHNNSSSNLIPGSPTKRRRQQQQQLSLNELKLLLASYDQQFNKLREETGSEDIDQITKKYMKEYEQNYGTYKYINNLTDQIAAEQEETEHLENKIQEVKIERNSNVRGEEVEQLQHSIAAVKHKVEKLKDEKTVQDRILLDLKLSLPVVLERIGIQPDHPGLKGVDLKNIQDSQLVQILLLIEDRKKQLVPNEMTSSLTLNSQNAGTKNAYRTVNYDVDQQTKRQYEQFTRTDLQKKHMTSKDDGSTRYESFLNREQIIKTIELDKRIKKPRKKI